MEVDAAQNRGKLPGVCHRCGKPGHFRNQCPRQYDVRFMSTEELEEHLQAQLVQKDVVVVTMTDPEMSEEGREEEDAETVEEEDFA